MKTIRYVIFLSFIFTQLAVSAQFEIQGIIRPRFEFRNGYGTLRNYTTSPAAFVSQRSRLNIKYKSDKIEMKFSFYDFRVWGDQVWKKDIPSLGIHEAWAKFNINKYWSVKLGRQSLKYDNSRLLSAVNWNQIGAAHDAAVVYFRKNGWAIDIAAAWNQSAQNIFGTFYDNYETYYKSLNFLWFSKSFGNINISSLNIIDGMQDSHNSELINFRSTNGINLIYKKDNFNASSRFYLQTAQSVNAYYTNIDLQFTATNRLTISIGNEIKSGTNALDSLNTICLAFDIAYGGRHKFNGRMDYFSTPYTTKNAGLIDTYLNSDFKLSENTNLLAEYHYFLLQNNYVYSGTVLDKFLGHEFDFVLRHKIDKYIKLESGYSFILGSKSLDIIKSGNSELWNNWFYLMITIDPILFSTNK